MSSFNVPREYNNPAGVEGEEVAIPASLAPTKKPVPIASSAQIRKIQASSGSSASPSGVIQFQLPNVGYLAPASCYVKCRVTVTNANANAADIKFGGSVFAASAIVNRLTVLAGGSQPLEQINNYWALHGLMAQHASSASYVSNDMAIMEYAGRNIGAAVAQNATASADVIFPLISGALMNPKSLPLWLINGCVIQLDLNTDALALTSTQTGATYVVSTPELVFQHIMPEESFTASLRASLASGRLLRIPYKTFLNTQASMTSGGNLAQSIGLNVSSLEGIFAAQFTASTVNSNKYALENGRTNWYTLVDGSQYPQFYCVDDATCYGEMTRALGSIFDTAQTSSVDGTTYQSQGSWVGVSLRRFSENDLSQKGSPANLVQVFIEGATANSTAQIFSLYECVMLVDASGNVSVAR